MIGQDYRPPLTILTAWHGHDATITVRGDIDITTAGRLRRQLTQALQAQPRQLCLDLASSRYIDVAGCRALFRAACTRPPGRALILRSPSPLARRILQLTGLDQLCHIEYPASQIKRPGALPAQAASPGYMRPARGFFPPGRSRPGTSSPFP